MTLLNSLSWQQLKVSEDRTHHVLTDRPAYANRFEQVLSFHAPGLAAVEDETGGFHIDVNGNEAYSHRYTRTFGFYYGRAAVNDHGQWYHILPNGERLYDNSYAWCGNYQDELCTVRHLDDSFSFIDMEGQTPCNDTYAYLGDFREGVAVAHTQKGAMHINRFGQQVHTRVYEDLDVFHKGFARAKDDQGWCHIDKHGQPIYQERYAHIEPFYNGVARVQSHQGTIALIDESGSVITTIKQTERDMFHTVSADLVSYWRVFSLKAAVEIGLFAHLPASLEHVQKRVGLPLESTETLLLALLELGYVENENKTWKLSAKGELLNPDHPYSLANASVLWTQEHFKCWEQITPALSTDHNASEIVLGDQWFDYLDKDPKKTQLYHNAIHTYAKKDYRSFLCSIDLGSHERIIDVGGSTGALLELLHEKWPSKTYDLLDKPALSLELPSHFEDWCTFHPMDFFGMWPQIGGDAVILCRVLHDWPDDQAKHILAHCRKLLTQSENSSIYVIENLLNKKTGSGALLNLNMRIMTGGKERTPDDFEALFQSVSCTCESVHPLNEAASLMTVKPL